MSAPASSASAPPQAKRGALTDEVFDSSPSLLRPTRGKNAVAGLQQYFAPPEAAELIAAVNGRTLSTLDLTAGDGSLLAEVDPDLRFGIEIDADQVKVGGYEAIHGDVQRAYPLLRLLGTEFPRLACNPPFGLDWTLGGKRENSTVATWRMAMALLAGNGAGAFIAGRDRFAREVLPRPDAAGIYALIECPELFERVALACTIAFFVAPDNVIEPREGGPLRLSSARPSPFARLALQQRRELRGVERLNGQPTTYFALNLREWRQLNSLAAEDALTLEPALREAVAEATAEAEQAVCPLYEVRPQQRLAFLDDLDQVRCIAADPEPSRFPPGKRSCRATSTTTPRPAGALLRAGGLGARQRRARPALCRGAARRQTDRLRAGRPAEPLRREDRRRLRTAQPAHPLQRGLLPGAAAGRSGGGLTRERRLQRPWQRAIAGEEEAPLYAKARRSEAAMRPQTQGASAS